VSTDTRAANQKKLVHGATKRIASALKMNKLVPLSGAVRSNGKNEVGAQGRNRTTDTAIFSRMLYQLSYLGMPRAVV
jgi:hypothetical protein